MRIVYNKWTENRLLEKVNTVLRQRLREKKGRNPDPTGAIIDSQSVKGTPESPVESGFDGGKLVKGRKQHIVVDTIGCLLVVWVHAANIYDLNLASSLRHGVTTHSGRSWRGNLFTRCRCGT